MLLGFVCGFVLGNVVRKAIDYYAVKDVIEFHERAQDIAFETKNDACWHRERAAIDALYEVAREIE